MTTFETTLLAFTFTIMICEIIRVAFIFRSWLRSKKNEHN